jgi:uncharacterized protein
MAVSGRTQADNSVRLNVSFVRDSSRRWDYKGVLRRSIIASDNEIMHNQLLGLLIVLCVLCVLSPLADAAGFDCKVAIGMVENLVCRDAELSKLDDQLATSYQSALKATKDRKLLEMQQKSWLLEIRNRCWNPMCLISRYKERIEQLSSATPLISPPTGTFQCVAESRTDNEEKFESKSLRFRFQKGKLVEFEWNATWAPKSSDLRPGFHYRSNFSLSTLHDRLVPGFLMLEQSPIPGLPEHLQRYCGVALSTHGEKLYVYSVGCEGRPKTSHFGYTFHQENSACRLMEQSAD